MNSVVEFRDEQHLRTQVGDRQLPKTGETLPKTGETLPKTGETLPKTGETLSNPVSVGGAATAKLY